MKNIDLMIGDWMKVKTSNNPIIYKYRQIRSIFYRDGVYMFETTVNGEKRTTTYLRKDLLKVGLTPDILMKIGFEKKKYRHEYTSFVYEGDFEYCHIRMYMNGDFRIIAAREIIPTKKIEKNIKGIHELQHALKEVGIKKEIVL